METTIGERLKAAREAKGLSLEDANYEMRRLLDRSQWVSYTTLHRYERADDEAKVGSLQLWALSQVYGVPLAEFSVDADVWIRDHFRPSALQIRRSEWNDVCAGSHAA